MILVNDEKLGLLLQTDMQDAMNKGLFEAATTPNGQPCMVNVVPCQLRPTSCPQNTEEFGKMREVDRMLDFDPKRHVRVSWSDCMEKLQEQLTANQLSTICTLSHISEIVNLTALELTNGS